MSRDIEYPHLELLFKGKINQNMILERWDDLLRSRRLLKVGLGDRFTIYRQVAVV